VSEVRLQPKVMRLGIATAIVDGEKVDLSGLSQSQRDSIRMTVKKLRRARKREANDRVR
jgi:hypothetical protein